ncbi:MAG: hypothetical protein K1X75_15190 [Leptospirales bacterium]|nr:hypothetical protein [Leptospirales bacterium]
MHDGIARRRVLALAALLLSLALAACPKNQEDAIMLSIYHDYHQQISDAVYGTDIEDAYLAAIISLESHPPGNADSERYEAGVYRHLVDLKEKNVAWGGLSRRRIEAFSDSELKELATSYGLVQIMGYHCLSMGCTVADLRGQDQLLWAVAFMQTHYGKLAHKQAWARCFRMHNTGSPEGETARDDYVQRGLLRMDYYREWVRRNGGVW